jgi:hypothetical protein
MATVAVQDLISASLRLINVLGVGDSLDADTANNCLYALNDMLDGWNLESLMIYTITSSTWNLVAGKQTYQMGPTAVAPDFPAPRPVKIQAAGILINGMEFPLDLLGDDEWEATALKSLVSSIPTALYNQGSYPNTALSLWPLPGAPYQLVLYTWQNIPAFATVNDQVSFPPGYAEALRYNLAVRLAIEFQRPLSPAIADLATSSKAKIKRNNEQPPLMSCDPAILGGPRWGSLSDFLGGR